MDEMIIITKLRLRSFSIFNIPPLLGEHNYFGEEKVQINIIHGKFTYSVICKIDFRFKRKYEPKDRFKEEQDIILDSEFNITALKGDMSIQGNVLTLSEAQLKEIQENLENKLTILID